MQFRFLLRGSALVVAMLALWWVGLRAPMMAGLRGGASVVLGLLSSDPVELDESGDWVFRIAADGSGGQKISSLEFTVPRSDVTLFTVSVPVLWAILLAAPVSGRTIRPMLLGTLIAGCIEVISLVVFVELIGHSFVGEGHPAATGVAAWVREVANYLVLNVVPDIAPVIIAVSVYPELRALVFAEGDQRIDARGTAGGQPGG